MVYFPMFFMLAAGCLIRLGKKARQPITLRRLAHLYQPGRGEAPPLVATPSYIARCNRYRNIPRTAERCEPGYFQEDLR